jgi:spore coat protein CotF
MTSIEFIKCSRAGCQQAATANIAWRNPKIHAVDRRKIWSACDEHKNFLVDYLSSRGFEPELKVIA